MNLPPALDRARLRADARPMKISLPFLRRKQPVVAVLRLDGAIGPSASRFRSSSLDIRSQAARIERAFKTKRVRAVALVVNSPGGSPAQADLIAKRIRDLAAEEDVPVFAFAEDVAASGGYWLACAGDEIYVTESSIVGSIGVIFSGFGFQDLIARYGVERRVHTAGENKGALDPFVAEREDDVTRLKAAQSAIHDSFKRYVTARRGARLDAGAPDLFSGAFWTGVQAVDLGLADGIGDVRTVMREKFGEKVRLVPIMERRSALRSFLGRTEAPVPSRANAGTALIDALIDAVEERFLWSRFGL
jgi:signal peptide peptidase SppA